MRSFKALATALNDFYKTYFEKNIKNRVYNFLFTLHTNSLFSTDTVQQSLSLSSRFKAWTISTGTVVRNDFECEVCKFTVDSNSNNFITPFLLFFVNIFNNIV